MNMLKNLSEITRNINLELANDIIDREVEHMDERLKNQVTQQGMEWKQYLELTKQTGRRN